MSLPTANALLSFGLTGIKTADKSSPSQATPGGVALLTRQLAAGEEAAFREFHERYFERLYQFLLVVARGQEHEAQEAMQETLLRVARHAREFETEDAFWSWLKVVARSAACDAGRKRQRYRKLLDRFALRWKDHASAASKGEDDCLGTLLEETLNGLPLTDRRLIEGKYLDGETVKELSAQTGLTDKAVESRLVRLRRDLRARILTKLRGP